MKPNVIIFRDNSKPWDGYDWHDEFIQFLSPYIVNIELMDFVGYSIIDRILEKNPEFLLWRAWHVPEDRDRDRTFIEVMNSLWGIKTYPYPEMHRPYDNKIYQYLMAKKYKWNIPKTEIFFSLDSAIFYSNNCDLPVIVKASDGACSQNVKIIKERSKLIALVNKIFSVDGLPLYFNCTRMKNYIIIQQFFTIDYSWRIVCVGNEIVFSGTLFPHDEDINLTAEQQWRSIENAPSKINQLSLDITKTLEWPWIAFDLVEYDNKPYLLEFSASFGFSAVDYFKKETGSPNAWVIKKMMDELARRHSFQKEVGETI